MNLPKSVRIGGFDYRVKQSGKVDPNANIGSVVYHKRRIIIDKKLSDEVKFEVLWHECIHVFFNQVGRAEEEEGLVQQLGFGISQILRDNPYLRGEHLFRPPMVIVADMSTEELAAMSAADLTAHFVESNNGDSETPPSELKDAVIERLLDNSPEKSL